MPARAHKRARRRLRRVRDGQVGQVLHERDLELDVAVGAVVAVVGASSVWTAASARITAPDAFCASPFAAARSAASASPRSPAAAAATLPANSRAASGAIGFGLSAAPE